MFLAPGFGFGFEFEFEFEFEFGLTPYTMLIVYGSSSHSLCAVLTLARPYAAAGAVAICHAAQGDDGDAPALDASANAEVLLM